jgi:hypothetical protein
MILVDLSQVLISNIFANIAFMAPIGRDNHPSDPSMVQEPPVLDEGLIRHMALNSLRYYRGKFRGKYGELVICADNKNYWRKEIFPYYKAGRKKDRDNSKIDWHIVFDTLNKLRQELIDFFPYKVLNVNRAEADDLIGVIAKREHMAERVLVLSGDKDFAQLQKYKNIDQYAPIQKKFITVENPIWTLREHIMLGDHGDGIPNFLSDDDTFVKGKRQKSIRRDNLARWIKEKPENFCDIKMLRGYKRNRELIDLDCIPPEVQEAIIDAWEEPFNESRSKLMQYFIDHRLSNLIDHIGEF